MSSVSEAVRTATSMWLGLPVLGAAVGMKGFSEVVLSKFFAVEIIVGVDFPLGLLKFGFTVLCCKRE